MCMHVYVFVFVCGCGLGGWVVWGELCEREGETEKKIKLKEKNQDVKWIYSTD